jgi:hypothetical protein
LEDEDRLMGGLFLPERFRSVGGSGDQPSPLVNIEFHQTFVTHFQEQGLAGFLIRDVGASHDLEDLERLLAKRIQDIFSVIQQD